MTPRLLRAMVITIVLGDFNESKAQQAAIGNVEDDDAKRMIRDPQSAATPNEIETEHVVQPGETLSSITERYFGSLYEWPRIWSYNPEITNPNWIYPNTIIKLTGSAGEAPRGNESLGRRGLGAHKHSVRRARRNALYLANEGFIDPTALRDSGVVAGSPVDHMTLTQHEKVYVQFKQAPTEREYTLFRNINLKDHDSQFRGTLQRISGTLRIDSYDAKSKVAQGVITEALEPIERGFAVAPSSRHFKMIDPKPNQKTLDGQVVAAVHPLQYYTADQMIFIDKGSADGIQEGNRLFIVRYGDQWREDLFGSETKAGTILQVETAPPKAYPVEIIGEARVVDVRNKSAGCYVTSSSKPIVSGDTVRFRSGY